MTSPLPVAVPGARLVTSICDLVPLRLPNTTPDNKSRMLKLLRTCARNSELIVTVSEASKADIVNILGVPDEKVQVTYLATDMRKLSGEDKEHLPRVMSRFSLEQQKYLLFVSAIEPKKNLRRVIEAFLEIDTDMPLVIVGRKAWMWEQEIGHLESLGENARRRLRFLGYVPRADLRYLYAGARALAFPSLYEGFGLPALEAMKMGCPVLTSDIDALHEVCGTSAVYANPYDTTAIRKGLERLIGDDRLAADLTQSGLARADTFSNARFVEHLGRAYQKLA
jgi:glycosyltransferase involved in cell wall biosynthesis